MSHGPQNVLHGAGFIAVANARAEPVRMNMREPICRNCRQSQCPLHGQSHGPTVRANTCSIAGVPCRMPQNLCIDSRPTSQRMLQLLKHQHRRAFTKNHALSGFFKRTAPASGVSISHRDLLTLKSVDCFHWMHTGARRACKHHVGCASLDRAGGLPDRQVPAGLAQGQRIAWATQVVKNRNMAGWHVR